MIDVTDYPIAQPTREIEAPQASDTVNIGDSTEETINSDIKSIFEDRGMTVGEPSFDDSLTLKEKNIFKKELAKLSSEYNFDVDYEGSHPVTLSFRSRGNIDGHIVTSNEYKKVNWMNFGHRTQKSRTVERNAHIIDKGHGKGKFVLWNNSKVDLVNERLSTLTHEFAHVIASTTRTENSVFFKELKVIRKQYNTKLKQMMKPIDLEAFNKVYMGKYGQTNLDEFMAEAFTEYKLSSKPTPYAVKVGKLIDKHFKK